MRTTMKRVLSLLLLASSVCAQKSFFINPKGIPSLPTQNQALAAAATANLALDDIQGDILVGMHKDKELFFFFNITDVASFKTHLAKDLHPLLTTSTQALSTTTSANAMINIGFSQLGLNTLGVTDNLGDSLFSNGQRSDFSALGDPSLSDWQPEFQSGMHGILLIASNDVAAVNDEATSILNMFGGSITEVYRLLGQARPGSEAGHEHFGFKDGIANPAVNGFNNLQTFPGQTFINPGVLLLSETGDTTTRPSWAKDGTFLAFRQLKQLVPEFNKFLLDHALTTANGSSLTKQQGADLLGARMVGRWKSGTPVDLAPFADDATIGNDASKNNNFNYADAQDGLRCPFSAHIRKTNPRSDFTPENTANHIMRAGIPYGPEVTDAENSSGASGSVERGLAFVSYQSSLSKGFHFIQQTWANNANFRKAGTGFDPIIGANKGAARTVGGLDPGSPSSATTMTTDFVVSKGGEYFFVPSLSALLTKIAV